MAIADRLRAAGIEVDSAIEPDSRIRSPGRIMSNSWMARPTGRSSALGGWGCMPAHYRKRAKSDKQERTRITPFAICTGMC